MGGRADTAAGAREGGGLQIANEFTVIQVRHVRTKNGERLEIESPRLGYRIQLDALELESLTWQPKETFTRLLELPFGPGAELRVGLLSTLMPEREES
jgi:hypothetical protein